MILTLNAGILLQHSTISNQYGQLLREQFFTKSLKEDNMKFFYKHCVTLESKSLFHRNS